MLLVLYAALMTKTGHETVTESTGYADHTGHIGHTGHTGHIGDTSYTSRRRRFPPDRHRWHLCVAEDGQLTAMLAGSEPPLTVSGESLANLRRQIRNVTLRGLL